VWGGEGEGVEGPEEVGSFEMDLAVCAGEGERDCVGSSREIMAAFFLVWVLFFGGGGNLEVGVGNQEGEACVGRGERRWSFRLRREDRGYDSGRGDENIGVNYVSQFPGEGK